MAGEAATTGSVGGYVRVACRPPGCAAAQLTFIIESVSLFARTISPSAATFEAELPFPPLLESRERTDHPSQMRLSVYRDAIRTLTAPALAAFAKPLALGFYVAGRPDIAGGCDLDNFLTPVVKALGGSEAFSFVWATRGRASDTASLTITRATDVRLDMEGRPSHASARLSLSPARPEWRAALAAAAGRHEAAMDRGPVELALRFGVSPQRNWVSLWKPAIDRSAGFSGEPCGRGAHGTTESPC